MFDTIIIGAGIAGLAAGEYLINNSSGNFVVLESFNKIGGRVQTTEFANKTYPTGPGWAHGKIGNPIYEILSNLGVSMQQSDFMTADAVFVWDCKESKDVSIPFLERSSMMNDLVANIMEQLEGQTVDPQKSLYDIFTAKSKYFTEMSDFDKAVLFIGMEIYMGASLQEVSALAELQCDGIYEQDGEVVNFRIEDPLGVPKLIRHLCRNFEDKIQLNCRVQSIDWQNNCGHVIVTTDDGRQFHGKNVIITVQSALLAKGSISFQPSLPSEKLKAWSHVPAVNYCRIFAKFPKKFWPDYCWLVPIVKDANPFNELLLWQNCAKQNLCSEEDNILVCHYTSGSIIDQCRFDVEKESLIELVTNAMRNIFPHDYCAPVDVQFVSHWNNGRFAGSYSIPGVGLDECDIKQLQESVGPLHFAGESVIVKLIGTMQAAYLSGQQAAQKTLQ